VADSGCCEGQRQRCRSPRELLPLGFIVVRLPHVRGSRPPALDLGWAVDVARAWRMCSRNRSAAVSFGHHVL